MKLTRNRTVLAAGAAAFAVLAGLAAILLLAPRPGDDDWSSHGRTPGEQRFSPLRQISLETLPRLGLAWEAPLANPGGGVEATPIVVDGVIYVSSTYGQVYAFDGATGRPLWSFDPQVPADWLRMACCKAVNRGVAVSKGRVFVGALDGRLFALDAATGARLWQVDTTGHKPNYSITGAPRVVKDKVIIGNGGADFGVRGFISAYDADSGKLAWRFFTTPGDPAKGFEHPELAVAAKTWDPKRDWLIGGGGTAWDSMSYDPDLDLLYVGTGNAGPADPRVRNPGGGDSLFVSSILALKPDTGRLAWWYQTTPGDQWDYTATQTLTLAEIELGGTRRKVLMQAPKNGFFYVLDRGTGKLLSADKYVRADWADHVDLKTGRPAMSTGADYTRGERLVFPSPYGGHNWQPAAFSPRTGLVYIPARDLGWVWNPGGLTWFYQGADPGSLAGLNMAQATRGLLIAWDPVARKARWTAPQPTLINGGLLVTAANLLVQGTEDGFIDFRDARTGALARRLQVGTGVVAPPISYAINGVQYIAVAAGWNGVKVAPPRPGEPPPYDNSGRLIVLRLGGGPIRIADRLEPQPFLTGIAPQPAALVDRGRILYRRNCLICHGAFGERTQFPDLRRISRETYDGFDDIVRGGAYRQSGMASFADALTPADSQAIRAYLADWAAESRARGADQSTGQGSRDKPGGGSVMVR
jgi:quinohemoprotein ethanol dehydrogenase